MPDHSGRGLFCGSAFADDNERRPKGGLRLLRLAMIDECQHGLPHGLGAAHALIRRELAHGAGDELHGCIGGDLPMRDEQRAGLGVDEGAGEAR